MSKDSHFTGQPVYSQVLKLLDKEKILQISRETNGSEAYVKRFDGYQHLVVMLYSASSEKINPEVLFYGTSGRNFMLLGVLPDSNRIFTLIVQILFDSSGKNRIPQQ